MVDLIKKSRLEKFKERINSDYPNFKITSIKSLKAGWDNYVVEINKTYIFRFHKKGNFNLEKEIKVLQGLKNKITLEIPNYEFIGKESVYVGYKKIIGGSLTPEIIKNLSSDKKEKLAHDLANFFDEFHRVWTIAEFKKIRDGRDDLSWQPEVIKKYSIKRLEDQILINIIKEFLIKEEKFDFKKAKLVVAYNDLHGNNVAFSQKEEKLTGIFDFSDVAINDVNIEFYRLFLLDPELAVMTIKKYEKLSGRRVSLERVFANAIICAAAIWGVYSKKPNSKKAQAAFKDLMTIKNIYLDFKK
jgi:hypothetical protein